MLLLQLSKSSHNTLVVVGSQASMEQDPELARLQEIPSFLPIMRASLSGSGGGAKDPDILERLDYRGLLSLCQRSENYLRKCAVAVSTEQAEINRGVRQVDQRMSQAVHSLSERQKSQTRSAEKIRTSLADTSKCLTRCHALLNENIEQLEALNNLLPAEERLEPFVWTTG